MYLRASQIDMSERMRIRKGIQKIVSIYTHDRLIIIIRV